MKKSLLSLASAILALALGFLSCGGPDAPDAGGPIKIAVLTPFPTGTTANAAVDIKYEATPSGGASIAQVSYSINGGAEEYIYLAGGNGVTPKGTLGAARVMLAPGENHVVFMAKDSVGNSATFNVANSPTFDFGTVPYRSGEHLVSPSTEGAAQYIANCIVVIAKYGATDDQVANAAKTINGSIVGQANPVGMYWLQVPGQQTEAQLKALCDQLKAKHLNLFYAAALDTLIPIDPPKPSDPRQGASVSATAYTNDPWWNGDKQWGLTAMNVPDVWQAYKGKLYDTKVGVVDGGFLITHEDLQLQASNIYGGSVTINHGTHVMGTIGAIHNNGKGLAGVMDAKRGSLYGYDIFSFGSGALAGLGWTVANGAKAVNFSIATPNYPYNPGNDALYSGALRNLLDKGYDFVVVQGAGNDVHDVILSGLFAHVTDPALRQRIITVGAVDSEYQMASFTCYGPLVDVVAPGVNIYSSVAESDSSYASYQGTSMAGPHVTGLAGLVYSADPGLTGDKVKQIIVDSAKASGRTIVDTRSSVPPSERLTYYFPNAKAAVDKAIGSGNVLVEGVTLNKTSTSLGVGATETLIATVAPSNAANKNVTWDSSDPTKASVSNNGVVTGVAAGTATITVRTNDGGKTATCVVTVAAGGRVPVTSVSLNKTSTTVFKGTPETLTATVLPSNATNKSVTWWSSDTEVATVSNGIVTGRANGAAMITATSQDSGMVAACSVTVYVPVTSVSIDKSLTVSLGWRTALPPVTIQPRDATNKNVTWSSSNTAIVEVNGNGVVMGKATSTAIITVTTEDGGYKATCEVTVSASPKATTVSAGEGHTFAIMSDGSLLAWGSNGAGQLGLDDNADRNAPVRMGTANDWAAVSAGAKFSIALNTDGSLWAWGSNDSGQLGDGTNTNRNAPVRVGTANDWAAMSAGANFSMALKSDDSLWAWGSNDSGQLGLGDNANRNAPVRVGTANDWKAVSAGADFSLALKKDGSLWAWGNNGYGKLGLGNNTNRNAPVRVGAATDWEAVSAGRFNAIALKSGGSIWEWGAVNWSTTPVRVGTANDWKAVSAGGYQCSFALKKDNSLWAWGNSSSGQLGLGNDDTFRSAPVLVGAAKDWAAVTAGQYYTLAIKIDGSIWAWGSNGNGQLGVGDEIGRNVPTLVGPLPVPTISVTNVTLNKASTTIAVGGTETLVAAVVPSYATNSNIIWSSSNESVATVSSDGVVTGVGVGPATIKAASAADSTKFATCAVTVSLASVSISASPKALFVNGTAQLQTSVVGLSNTAVTWSVPPGQGTITSAGLYTAPATPPSGDGVVTITATSVENTSISGQAKILIRPMSFANFDGNTKTNPQLLDLANAFGSTAKADLDKYDINGDGKVDDEDLAMLFKAMGW